MLVDPLFELRALIAQGAELALEIARLLGARCPAPPGDVADEQADDGANEDRDKKLFYAAVHGKLPINKVEREYSSAASRS
jgi:hypothetical protein